MKITKLVWVFFYCFLVFSTKINGAIFFVESQQEFTDAHDNAAMNDSIIWLSGVYPDIYMNIKKDHLNIMADTLGGTIFTGLSRVNITSDYVLLQGFQFLDGNIGTRDVINTTGSYNKFNQLNIRAYRSYKYLRVREECQYVEITYCNFENRINLADQNILSILVDDTNPGYHKIQHCSFKNFKGTGNDLGIEPIRIGVSSQADFISRSLVEYCYFTQCSGDGEIISSKASQNVYRFNTFENNPLSELVLRHGSENIVYGNFFLNGKGGIRVREGQDQYIYNNYFYDLDDRSIYLQNEDSDPLDNINIGFNTVIDCAEVILGGSGNDEPTNVTFANNIFSDPDDELFREATGNETWIGNIAFGDLGISLPSSGITIIDPQLEQNSEGFFGLSQSSPAINAALSGYKLLPQFEGMEDIDTDLLFDLMRQSRPSAIEEKDLGCNEYPHDIVIKPFVTEENTGPSYDTSLPTGLKNNTQVVEDLIKINPNPVSNQLNIAIQSEGNIDLKIEIFNLVGQIILTNTTQTNISGEINFIENIEDFPAGSYFIRATGLERQDKIKRVQTIKFVKPY